MTGPNPNDVWDIALLDLEAYLARIGHDGDVTPGVAALTALHRAHVATIPFENLDIALGRGIGVTLADVQGKLVERRRGGYCYEHGLLFAAALQRLGFSAERLLARVGADRERPRGRTHMLLRVVVDGEPWLADVGFGSGLLEPVPFASDGPREQGGWAFAVATDGPHEWSLEERRGGTWETLYRFEDQRVHPADVVVANHFTSTYPRSAFVGRAVVVRKDEDALRELVDRTLTLTRPDGSAETREIPDADLGATLRDVFGLDLSDEEIAGLVRARA